MSKIRRRNGGKLGMYGLISVLSAFIREWLLPNPFESLGAIGYVYNAIVGTLIAGVSFYLVSRVDKLRFRPAWRSFLFMLFYSVITLAVWAMSIHSFAWWWILIVELIVVVPIAGVATLVEYKAKRYQIG